MKVRISTLVVVASKVQANLDRNQFTNAVRAYVGRNADKETVSSQAKQSKTAGDYFVASLNQKTDKQYGVDAKAIHWLCLIAECAELDLGEIPKPSSEIGEWLAKFEVKAAVPATKPATK